MAYKVKQGLAPNYFSILAICSGMCQTYSHTRLSSRILPLEPACLTTLLHSDFCYNDVSSRRPPLTTQCNIVSHPHPCPALFCFLAYLIIYIIYIFFILYCFSSQCIDICLPWVGTQWIFFKELMDELNIYILATWPVVLQGREMGKAETLGCLPLHTLIFSLNYTILILKGKQWDQLKISIS